MGANPFTVGQRIEILEDLAIENTELRWGEPSAERPFLHSGRFVIGKVTFDEIRLVDADWDSRGRLMSNTKHGHIIRGESRIAALAAQVRQPV